MSHHLEPSSCSLISTYGNTSSSDSRRRSLDLAQPARFRFEVVGKRGLAADAAAAYPGETLLRVRGMTSNAYTQDLYLDDVRLSNAMTVEHNMMGPGVARLRRAAAGGQVGHILHVTQTDPTTYARADRWLHYDQVGSVLSESDATGNFIQRHEQDTFGNTLASWQTGLIGGDGTGWHHNTKEWDGEVGLVFLGNRPSFAETGSFASPDPCLPTVEHPYISGHQNPVMCMDVTGRKARRGWRAGEVDNQCPYPVYVNSDPSEPNPGWHGVAPGARTDDGKEDADWVGHPGWGEEMHEVGPWDITVGDDGGSPYVVELDEVPAAKWGKGGKDDFPAPPGQLPPMSPFAPPLPPSPPSSCPIPPPLGYEDMWYLFKGKKGQNHEEDQTVGPLNGVSRYSDFVLRPADPLRGACVCSLFPSWVLQLQ